MNYQGENIEVGYGKNAILFAKNLKINGGECSFLLGVNGSGKSTLLRTLAALQKPLKGSLKLMGKSISDYSISDLSQQISLVQSQSVRPDFIKVKDYVAYGRMPYTGMFGVLKKVDFEKIEEALSLLGIEELKGRTVVELSDGEFQKVKLAQAFCQDTRFLFVDEPAAHLDIAAKHELFHLLKKIANEKQRAVVIATHEVELALKLSGSLWLIHQKELKIASAKSFLDAGLIDEIFGNQYVSFNDKQT